MRKLFLSVFCLISVMTCMCADKPPVVYVPAKLVQAANGSYYLQISKRDLSKVHLITKFHNGKKA